MGVAFSNFAVFECRMFKITCVSLWPHFTSPNKMLPTHKEGHNKEECVSTGRTPDCQLLIKLI